MLLKADLSTMTLPKISVVLPVYNGGDYLKLSIDSVLKQDFSEFELLVLDDCSNDGSWEFLQSIEDDRVRIFRNPANKGLFFNLNKMIRDSRTPLVKLWAQDDIMYPNCLDHFFRFHQEHPEVGFSYCARDIIDGNGGLVRHYKVDHTPMIVSSELHAEISFEHGSIAGNIANVCITREALNKVGLYNESMKISADFEMQVRIAQYFPVGFINVSLIQLRDHERQLSRNAELYIFHVKEDFQVYKKLFSYVSDPLKKRGRILLRKQKLMFYYTLMMQTLLKGNFKTAKEYFRLLIKFDNFFLLSFSFIRSRLKGQAKSV